MPSFKKGDRIRCKTSTMMFVLKGETGTVVEYHPEENWIVAHWDVANIHRHGGGHRWNLPASDVESLMEMTNCPFICVKKGKCILKDCPTFKEFVENG